MSWVSSCFYKSIKDAITSGMLSINRIPFVSHIYKPNKNKWII